MTKKIHIVINPASGQPQPILTRLMTFSIPRVFTGAFLSPERAATPRVSPARLLLKGLMWSVPMAAMAR